MVDVLVEAAERAENWYTSAAKERVFSLRSRFYSDRAMPVHQRIRYRRFVCKRVACEFERDKQRKTLIRRKRPQEEARGQHVLHGVVPAVQKMIELLELPTGWNSYSASQIKKENVNFAVGLLAQVMRADTPTPQVIPMVGGGVQLEWHTRGINLEISIYSPAEVNFI